MIGGAVGVELSSRAYVRLPGRCRYPEGFSRVLGVEVPIDGAILKSISRAVGRLVGWTPCFRVFVESEVPVASGLKSSSSLVVSIVRALLEAVGARADQLSVVLASVEASIESGITVTGAFDDHLAAACEGVFITDNRSMRVLRAYEAPRSSVVIWLPGAVEGYSRDPGVFARYSGAYRGAAGLALRGDWVRAMTVSGVLTSMATGVGYRALRMVAGLGEVAAFGVSGKGPAVFAVTEDPGLVERLWRGLGGRVIVTEVKSGGGYPCPAQQG
jgi:shikimate kinase